MKLICGWCGKPIVGDYETASWDWSMTPERVVNGYHCGGNDDLVHPKCAKQIAAKQEEIRTKEEQARQESIKQKRAKLHSWPVERLLDYLQDHPQEADQIYDLPPQQYAVLRLQGLLGASSQKTKAKQTKALLRKSGLPDDITFKEFWQGSPEIDYAHQQAEALRAHQTQLRRLRTVVYAKQIQVSFLKMTHEQQVLFIRTLTSDPDNKIAKLLELEGNLSKTKTLQASSPKRLALPGKLIT